MYILALNGSPNKDGNTAFLLDTILGFCEGAQTKRVDILDVLSSGRQAYCVSCSSPCNGACFKGTRVEEVFEEMKKADFILLGSPVYFGTASGIIKSFWDKTRILRSERALVGTKGAAVASGHSKFGGQETTIRALQDMMLVQGMTVVAEGARGSDAGHLGVASFESAKEDAYAIERCKVLGERIIDELSD